MDFIVDNLPILISVVLGIGLLIFEMFMPGFGIPGISGLILLFASVIFTWTQHGAIAGMGVAIIDLALAGLAASLSLRSATKGRLSRSQLILKGAQTKAEGFMATADLTAYVGRTGQTSTVLRPAGIAEFDGERLNVVTAGEFIPKNAEVIIKEVEGARILVEHIKTDSKPTSKKEDISCN